MTSRLAVAALVAAAACSPDRLPDAADHCRRAGREQPVASGQFTTVGEVRRLKYGPTAADDHTDDFPGAPDDALAAWCWERVKDGGAWQAYAVGPDGTVETLAFVMDGIYPGTPSGPPSIPWSTPR